MTPIDLIEQEIRKTQAAYDNSMFNVNKDIHRALQFGDCANAAKYKILVKFWQGVLNSENLTKADFKERVQILNAFLKNTPLTPHEVVTHQAHVLMIDLCKEIIKIAD
jgi:hypothetical protein